MKSEKIPKDVLMLGFVSMFMDMSSEIIHSLLPVFMVSVLGASTLTVGIIEGIAEGTASIVKIFSGVLSDWTRRRKPLLLLGYGLAAATRPLFCVATSAWVVLLARFTDRIGKGLRGAPRDAMVADLTPHHQRGAAYGLRQALDTAGSILGPACALALMVTTHNDFQLSFIVAMIPSIIVMVILVFGVKEPPRDFMPQDKLLTLKRAHLVKLSPAFWFVTVLAGVLTLARFSDAFLVLKANDVGLGATGAPVILMIMNIMYAAIVYPAGRLQDILGEYEILALSILALAAADTVLAFSLSPSGVFLGASLWGLHMGLSQGVLTAVVAKEAPAALRGTAFGIFNFISGIAVLCASVLAGFLWKYFGPSHTFMSGAIISFVALVGFILKRGYRKA